VPSPERLLQLCLLLACSACIPAAVLPPPIPLGDDGGRIEGGGLGVRAEMGSDCALERQDDGEWQEGCEAGLSGLYLLPGGFVSWRPRDRWEWGAFAALGTGGRLGVAGFGRYYLVDGGRVRLGLQADVGLLYSGVGLPVSAGLTDRVWIHTNPRIASSLVWHVVNGVSYAQTDLPIGFDLKATDSLTFTLEGASVVPLGAGRFEGDWMGESHVVFVVTVVPPAP
jgi:hypothetical protein